MTSEDTRSPPKLYRRRFAIVILAFLSVTLSAFHFSQYVSLADRVRSHYHVSDMLIDFTAMIFAIVYIVLAYPVTMFITSYGIKATFVLGAFLNAIGFCIKCTAINPDKFYIVLGGQTLAGIGQIFLLGAAPMIASAWFPLKQVATVTTLLFTGNYVGQALGFVAEGVLFNKGSNTMKSLEILSIFMVAVSTLVYLSTILVFREKPPTPPSMTQAIRDGAAGEVPLKELLCGRDFLAFLSVTNLAVSVFITLVVVLNPIILEVFDGKQTVVAITGVLVSVPGIISSPMYGMILDSTKAFRVFNSITYSLCIASTFMLLGALWLHSEWLLYTAATAFGLCLAGFISTAIDVIVELTFPVPEAVSLGVTLFVVNLTGIVLNITSAKLLDLFGPLSVALAFACLLLLGIPCLWCMKWNLKRQTAERVNEASKTCPSDRVNCNYH